MVPGQLTFSSNVRIGHNRPGLRGKAYSLAQPGRHDFNPRSPNLKRPSILPNCAREDRIRDGPCTLVEVKTMTFDLATFLEEAGMGRKLVHLKPKQVFFSQGNSADAIFY